MFYVLLRCVGRFAHAHNDDARKPTKTYFFSASASCFGLMSDLRHLRQTCVHQRRLEEEELVQTLTGNVSPEEGVQVSR